MAENQKERHSLGKLGEDKALQTLQRGKKTTREAPFDVVEAQS